MRNKEQFTCTTLLTPPQPHYHLPPKSLHVSNLNYIVLWIAIWSYTKFFGTDICHFITNQVISHSSMCMLTSCVIWVETYTL